MAKKPKPQKTTKPPSDAYLRITHLGVERVAVIDDLLIKGVASGEVARMIQQAWGENTDITLGSMRRTLDRYRTRVLGPRVIAFAAKSAEDNHNKSEAQRIYLDLNALEELQDLYATQKRRIAKGLKIEGQLGGILMDSLRDELLAGARMLQTIAELQLETGVLRRAPKVVRGLVGDESGRIAGFLLQEAGDPKVFQLMEEALEMIRGRQTALPAPKAANT